MSAKPSLLQPALIGGVFAGVLSALPFISAANVCCCLWVVSGGLLAAYFAQQNSSNPITPTDGALVGLMAGVAAAAVYFVVSIPVDLVAGPMMERLRDAWMERMFEMNPAASPEMREMVERFGRQQGETSLVARAVVRVIGFAFFLFGASIFSTLGGLLGAVIFSKRVQPQTGQPMA